jgi:hypothetical protein
MDQRRRRLVRGAAALAPLVLTLRSGALAAASCTGVKITQVTPDSATGVIADNSVIPGDVCAPNLHFCPDGKALTDSLGNDYQTVESDLLGNKTCGDAQYKGTTVAILSSQSATSMINAG